MAGCPAMRDNSRRMRRPERFDARYYERHYKDPKTRVASQQETTRLADHVSAALLHFDIAVRRILDVGCGLGLWREPLARTFPRASYVGLEYSEHLADELGWVHGSISARRLPAALSRSAFDLVVCQGVLQYLDDAEAEIALAHLARLCRGALYLEALTARDWRENADRSRTDGSVHLREGAWYRERLGRHFVNAGSGLFLARRAGVVLWELEALE